VADLFQPKSPPWVDGDLLNASNSANRWENALEALDTELDAAEDRISALEAADLPTTGAAALYGPTANRPQPVSGRLYLDTDLGYFIGGYGTEWKHLDGSAIVVGGDPGPGTGTAPTGMTAVVQTDNSIVLTWNPVSGADHYKLYEVRSPSGVSGADNITTTTSTRTPSSMGYYEYWVTAFVGGIESAQSNHAICSLPYGSSPDQPPSDPAGSPAELLNLNGTGGQWNLGIGYPSGHVDISPTDLYNGFSQAPYFYITSDGARVHFQVPMNGGKTSSNTKYPRCELREYIGSSKAAWSGSSGTHLMSGVTRIDHMAPIKQEMCIAQIHDGSDDTLQIRVEGTTWKASINGTESSTILGTFAWGVDVAWEIRLVNGTLTIKINGTTKITASPGYGSGQYFKVGCYAQQNSTDQNNDPTDYASCELRDLVVSHS
jgi:hypothetical protein